MPNAIGFLRLALIPVFLVVELSSGDGTGALGAALFAVIAWGDYADGIAARVTGQYSRLGALMDPVTDRLLVVSGVVVCWHFQLLPRWAIAVLALRELAMLALGRYGLQRGVELRINWPGRLAVAPVMGAFFFAMVGWRTVGEVLLYIGLALALVATGLYVRDGRDGLQTPSLKLSLTFWSILGTPAVAPARPARYAGASPREEIARDGDVPRPWLAARRRAERPDPGADRGGDRDLLQRRILHGKIDILRAELVNRLRKKHDGGEVMITGDDVQRLTDILAQHQQPDIAAGRPVVTCASRTHARGQARGARSRVS